MVLVVTDPSGAVVTTFDPPPASLDPLTADPEALWRYGFPDRPTDPAALQRWPALAYRTWISARLITDTVLSWELVRWRSSLPSR
jgi:hypothetical protein